MSSTFFLVVDIVVDVVVDVVVNIIVDLREHLLMASIVARFNNNNNGKFVVVGGWLSYGSHV